MGRWHSSVINWPVTCCETLRDHLSSCAECFCPLYLNEKNPVRLEARLNVETAARAQIFQHKPHERYGLLTVSQPLHFFRRDSKLMARYMSPFNFNISHKPSDGFSNAALQRHRINRDSHPLSEISGVLWLARLPPILGGVKFHRC